MPKTCDLIPAMQRRCARVAVADSTVRGCPRGTVQAAREFLSALPLDRFGTSSRERFRAHLDDATRGLMRVLPEGGRSWGLSRKLVNIFLRDATYTVYLRDAFELRRAEAFLEVPLDSIVVAHLKDAMGRSKLPRWATVRRLTRAQSARFQDAAARVAERRAIARVHLDAVWWPCRANHRRKE